MKTIIYIFIFSFCDCSFKSKDSGLRESFESIDNQISAKLKTSNLVGLAGSFIVKAFAEDQIEIEANPNLMVDQKLTNTQILHLNLMEMIKMCIKTMASSRPQQVKISSIL